MKMAGPIRDRIRGAAPLRAIVLAAAIAWLPASAISSDAAGVVTAADAGAQIAEAVAVKIEIPVPALTPGLPPPQASALSDRRIVAGVILVLFSGLAGLTYSMWRELGRRVRAS